MLLDEELDILGDVLKLFQEDVAEPVYSTVQYTQQYREKDIHHEHDFQLYIASDGAFRPGTMAYGKTPRDVLVNFCKAWTENIAIAKESEREAKEAKNE